MVPHGDLYIPHPLPMQGALAITFKVLRCSRLWRREFGRELDHLILLQQRFQELLTRLPPEKLGELTEDYSREKLNNLGLVKNDPIETARFHLTLSKDLLLRAENSNLEWVSNYLIFIQKLLKKFPAQPSEYRH